MCRIKDYTGVVLANNYGENVKIISLDDKNSSGTYKWFYECVYCKSISSDTISNIKKSKGCKNCRRERSANSKKIKINTLVERINNIDENFLLVGEYTNNSTPITLFCKKHELVFKATPSNIFLNNSIKCPECLKEFKQNCFKKYSIEDIRSILLDNGYVWINEDEYINASSTLKYRCVKCGNISKSNIVNIINGRKCSVCCRKHLKTTNDFKREVRDLVGNEYSVIGEYTGNKNYVLMKHNACGSTWNATPINFLYNGRRCPCCKSSRGEGKIFEFLSKNDIEFKRQHSFDDCKYINKLIFDFYLPKYNIVIEFQGRQHYESIDYMGGQKDFELRQTRDNIKRKYCKENCIRMVEIRYDEMDRIEKILTDIFSEK